MNALQPRTTDRRTTALAGLLGLGTLALAACTPAAALHQAPVANPVSVPAASVAPAVPAAPSPTQAPAAAPVSDSPQAPGADAETVTAPASPTAPDAPAVPAAPEPVAPVTQAPAPMAPELTLTPATTAPDAPAAAPATTAPAAPASTAPAETPAAAQVPVTPPAAPTQASCLPDVGLCFLPTGGTSSIDRSQRGGVDGWTTNDLVFRTEGLGDVARVFVSNGVGGVGGGCRPGEMANATIVASVRTQVTFPADAYHSDGVYAVQAIVPLRTAPGWAPRTFLTSTAAATQLGEVDACRIMMADITPLGPGSPLVWSYAGAVEPSQAGGMTRDEAEAALAGPVHQEALRVLATACRRP